jgi:hypothetical protein
MRDNISKAIFKRRNITASKRAFHEEYQKLESSQYAKTLGEKANNPADFVVDPVYTSAPMKK